MTTRDSHDLSCCISAIGIDDMFVIMSCLHQVPGDLSVEARVGQALRHAGTSITVTTATDVVAFSVGAVTVRSLIYWVVV